VGLLEEVEQDRAAGRIGGICGIRLVLERLDSADADDLRAVLADPEVMHATIGRVLKARGFNIGRESISNHRNGVCKCR
jgi:hypothetical protein